jgi:hypothetical protein
VGACLAAVEAAFSAHLASGERRRSTYDGARTKIVERVRRLVGDLAGRRAR